ncbi:hypothetical protein PVAP13_8KG018156 [Panicum virgatum]|uniref:Uncharacterized protein n=1 Tax=Panicum virgatum TaxID=38727 RepID=A0A8T0PFY4_PANVG|nr:hypothetical protein PVAP13_8KG018156 [Panicum virgatum]
MVHSSCSIVLPTGSYLASFNDRVTGHLDDRRISGLSGISVRAFFRWWSITRISQGRFLSQSKQDFNIQFAIHWMGALPHSRRAVDHRRLCHRGGGTQARPWLL